uniref:Secreted protein n=1 Tax=Mesocestoides corti TaxID=53468 RepID=A0A5K3FWY7_MESCO
MAWATLSAILSKCTLKCEWANGNNKVGLDKPRLLAENIKMLDLTTVVLGMLYPQHCPNLQFSINSLETNWPKSRRLSFDRFASYQQRILREPAHNSVLGT